MFSILSAATETALMVLEPAYKTYKELNTADTVRGADALTDGAGKIDGFVENVDSVDGAVTADGATDGGGVDAVRVSDPAIRRKLLVHWIVYATFRAVDCLVRPWLPIYNVFKIGAVVWLRAGGTETVYRTLIGPFLSDNEPAIDHWLYRYDQAKDTVATATTALSTAAADAVGGSSSDEEDVNNV